MPNPHIENNRHLWDEWTRLHLDTPSEYQPTLDRFRAGETILDEINLREVGEVAGKSMLHLQCHFGLDSLDWTRRGAAVTGVDFSPEAIGRARALSEELGIRAEFICSDVYDLPACLDREFDVVYSSGGILVWLPDLTRWAQIIARHLKPGGVFYLHDGHPTRRVLFPVRVDDTGRPAFYNYFSGQPTRIEERGSYAQPEAEEAHTAYYWVHGVGEIITALCAAGLRIEFMHEFPKVYEDYRAIKHYGPDAGEVYLLHNWAIPHQFSIRAWK